MKAANEKTAIVVLMLYGMSSCHWQVGAVVQKCEAQCPHQAKCFT